MFSHNYEFVNITNLQKPDINSVKREYYNFITNIKCNENSLKEIFNKKGDFIIEVGAKWCYPCWL